MRNLTKWFLAISAHLAVLCIVGCTSVKHRTDKATNEAYTAYKNPMQWADILDMFITRSGKNFYLISTTMHLMPGAPVMKSTDLVNWEIARYVFDKLADTPNYDLMEGSAYGRGQSAWSNRHQNGND